MTAGGVYESDVHTAIDDERRGDVDIAIVAAIDADDLADKMELLINLNDSELEKMSFASREKMVNEFDIRYVLPKYENAIKNLSKLNSDR